VAVTDDVDALVAQLKLTQAERKTAETRVAELEGTYGVALGGSILRKVLVSPIVVTPHVGRIEAPASCDWSQVTAGPEFWTFRGVSRFDSVISGGLAKGEVTVEPAWDSPDLLACIGIDENYNGPHPIAGGSGVVPDVEASKGPPTPPPLGDAPAEPWRSSIRSRGRAIVA